MTGADGRRGRGEHTRPAILTSAHPHDRTIERRHVVDVGRARSGEIAVLRVIRPLAELHAAHQLGNQEIRVRIPVSVPMCGHVDRHTGNRRREIGAVIEIEAPQVVLVGLPLAAVLADGETGNGLEHFGGPHDGPSLQLARRDRALARRDSDAHEVRGRIRLIGQIAKRAGARHRHVRAERERERDIHRGPLSGDDRDLTANGREVDHPEEQTSGSGSDAIDPVRPVQLGERDDRVAPGRVCSSTVTPGRAPPV